MNFKTILVGMTLPVLAACAGTKPPTISAADITVMENEFSANAAKAFTPEIEMPTDTVATYNGHIGSNLGGGLVDGFVGDLELVADFNNSTISGTADNFNLIADGKPDQAATGTLDVNGTVSGNTMTANAAGNLKASESGVAIRLGVDGDLDGTFRGKDGDNPDAVIGTFTGNVIASVAWKKLSEEFSGDFYAD